MKNNKLYRFIFTVIMLIFISGCANSGDTEVKDTGITVQVVTGTPTTTPTTTPTPTNTCTPTPTPTPTNTCTPTPTPTVSITIGMVGDVLLHTRVEEDCQQPDGSYDYNSIFANTNELIKALDIALVNQEVIIGGAGLGISAYPTFNADYSLAEALVNAGFDVALHATNHALDKGASGVVNCLSNWKKYPEMKVLGIYDSQEAFENQILYIEKEGITLAILNFTYGTNGISIPSKMPYCVGPLLTDGNKEKIGALLDSAEENSDFVIVVPHWGTEYTLNETSVQKNWNKFFYEHGVDLVIGAHPHVIEPVAVTDVNGTNNLLDYTEDENGHRVIPEGAMLTYYSIGNYVNWTSEYGGRIYQRMLGGLATVTLSVNEEGKVYILDFGVTPLVSHVEYGQNQVTVYELSDYTEELAATNEIRKQTENFSMNNLIKLCDDVWGELWKKSR